MFESYNILDLLNCHYVLFSDAIVAYIFVVIHFQVLYCKQQLSSVLRTWGPLLVTMTLPYLLLEALWVKVFNVGDVLYVSFWFLKYLPRGVC